MTQPPTQITRHGPGVPTPPRKRRGAPTWLVVVGVLAAACLGVGAVNAAMNALKNDDTQTPARVPAAAAPSAVTPLVNQQDLEQYWRDQFHAASWYSLTSTPTWDGSALTARTKLFPDEDAREPSLSICRAMMMYWLARNQAVQPVRVLDQAGNILASGRTETSSCAWRR